MDKSPVKSQTVSEIVENAEKHAADLDQALNVAGVGWYNLKYGLVLSLSLIAAILEPVGYAYVLPAARCDLNMTDSQRGFISSIPYIGIVLTSFPWGYLVDTQGRKRVTVWSSTLAGLFAVLAGFMPDLTSFTVCKFLAALCIAGPAAIPYTFIGEITPQRDRDLILSVVNGLQIIGSAFVPLFAWAVLPSDFRINFGMYDFRPWRLLNMVNGVLFLVVAAMMVFGPESPKYLIAQGRHDEALEVLQKMYAGNKGKSPKDFPIKRLKMEDMTSEKKRSFLVSLKDQTVPLLKTPYHKWILLNGILLFGVFATLNGLFVWVPDILNRVLTGGSRDESVTACRIIEERLNATAVVGECDDQIATSTFMINAAANSICAVIAVVGSTTVKFLGKKALLFIVYSIIGIFTLLVNFITQDVIFMIFLSSFPVMGICIGPINAYSVEIFPTQYRGMAVSLTMMLGRLGSVVGANVAGALINVNCPSTFYVFSGSLIFCAALVFLLPRTKNPSMVEKAIFSR